MSLKSEAKILEKVLWNSSDGMKLEYSLVEFSNKDLAIFEKKIGESKSLNGKLQKEVVFERLIKYGNEKVVEVFDRIKQKIPLEEKINKSLKKVQLAAEEIFRGVVHNVVPGNKENTFNIIIKDGERQFVLRTNHKSVVEKLTVGQTLAIKQTEQGLKVNLIRGLKR